MKSILSRDFRYTPAAATNIALTFSRERKRLKLEAEQRERDETEARAKSTPIRSRKLA